MLSGSLKHTVGAVSDGVSHSHKGPDLRKISH